jgi:preprotein translocase subunit YajC
MAPLLVLILLFFVMYTVMIRPQQRRAREHQALIAAVQVGDEVMTTAGIFGTVTAVEGDTISVEISPGVVMRVARAAIGRRLNQEAAAFDELDQLDEEPTPDAEPEPESGAPAPPPDTGPRPETPGTGPTTGPGPVEPG